MAPINNLRPTAHPLESNSMDSNTISHRPAHTTYHRSSTDVYLPTLAGQRQTNGMNFESMMEPYLQASTLLHDSKNPSSRTHLEPAFYDILEGVSRMTDERDLACHVYLLNQLVRLYKEDGLQFSESNQSTSFRYPRTLRYFRCLADISGQTASIALAAVLSAFWKDHGRNIAASEGLDALAMWARAVQRSCMDGASQREAHEILL